ncbi:hypothetical protein V8C26DRAFT_167216 [Trichoderma gracile]
MDSNLQSHPLHQLGQPQSQLVSQFEQPHLQQQQQQHLQQQDQQQQQQRHQLQQQPLDSASAAQDVLVEARKNLQVLIDSGLSKDLLHQWVDDDSFSLQLSFPGQQPPLSQNLSPSASATTPPASASTPIPSPLLSNTISASPSHRIQSPQASSLAPHLHPATPQNQNQTQIAPAPPASAVHGSPVASLSASSAATSPAAVSSSGTIGTSASPGNGAPPSIAIIKTEPSSFADDVSRAWAAAAVLPQAPASMSGAPPAQVARVAPAANVVKSDTANFISPSMSYLHHRPRISVSSTSSGSSGHASLWSVNSARSSMSWASASSSRTQGSLPMTPASSSSANKTNIYWCTSCETSFKRKYDWKRHEDEFHERWRKYPCPEPGCNRSFWGSNSFNQHHKQCHGCKTCPHAEKVVKFLRKRKYWACGFCSALHPARERHVEHVARHFESGLGKAEWMHSRVIYGLLHQPLIHNAWDALVSTKQAEFGGRRPQFSWHPSKTGRAQGFLEKENPGQLQDLLEFFSGDEGEAQWIVNIAFELSDMAFATPQPPAPVPSPQPQFAASMMAAPTSFPQQQQQQDARMSFAAVPSQATQQMLASSPSATSNPFGTSPYRASAFVPSQPFPSQIHQHSSDMSAPAPMAAPQLHLDKRELPPIPQGHTPSITDGMMDFEYSANPVLFEDWESIASSTYLDTTANQQQQQSNQAADWGIAQFYGNPNAN